MSAIPARLLDDLERAAVPETTAPDDAWPSRGDLGEGRRRVTRRDQLRRRRATRRRLVALVVLVLLVSAGLAAALLLLHGTPDRFAGVWWDPSSGRRVELVSEGDGYVLLYGAAKQRYTARERSGDLVVASALGGDIVIHPKGEDRLLLKEGGQTTVLSRLPDDR